jgi:hypothetical protein
MYLRPVHDVPSLLRVSPSSHPHVRPVGIGKQNKAQPPFLVAQYVFSVKKKPVDIKFSVHNTFLE